MWFCLKKECIFDSKILFQIFHWKGRLKTNSSDSLVEKMEIELSFGLQSVLNTKRKKKNETKQNRQYLISYPVIIAFVEKLFRSNIKVSLIFILLSLYSLYLFWEVVVFCSTKSSNTFYPVAYWKTFNADKLKGRKN